MEQGVFDQANEDVASWAKVVRKRLAMRVGGLTLKNRRALQKTAWNKAKDPDYKKLLNSIGSSTKKVDGIVSRVDFRFSRQGIYLERGAGRRRTLGTGAKPWIAPIVDPAIDELADMLVNKYADIITGEIKFTVPGIISRRVKLTVT